MEFSLSRLLPERYNLTTSLKAETEPCWTCVLGKRFPLDTRREELLLEESSEAIPQMDAVTSSAPIVPTNDIPVLRRSTRVSQQPERYGFLGLTGQLDNDPKTYGEAMLDIDLKKWIEAMTSEMDSMSSNKVWTLVDQPKGVKPIGCKWVYKRKLRGDVEDTTFKARLVAKGYTQRPGVDFEETYSSVAMAKSIRIMLAIDACRRVSHLLEKSGRSAVSKGPSMVSNRLPEARISILMSRQHTICCVVHKARIAFALSVTSRYQAFAGEAHWTTVKTILKYLRRTKDMFLVYGFVFKLNGGVVAWKNSKQDTTADSTTEAEYIAAPETAKETVWMKNYIQELAVVPSIAEPVVIFCDNDGAIVQAKEPRSHHRSKHILRCYHLLKEMVGRGEVRMDRVTSAEIADPLTKPVSQIGHAQHLDKMGLRNMSDWL
ncbi:UNVERIFIED_CONTAM: Retrovirus-related Pol polyprotein from transposon RE2 [Sesamum latifolium]|uniref:Retrovirus-related Pol polyprotein from transposon RE2 n=1 Tax=Sesamum latifolium TaxID=2727402 RepID=A0AAW2YA88_9LAMI